MMRTTRLCGLAVLAAFSFGPMMPALAQNAAAGAGVFKTQCSVCHSVEAGKKGIGPNLLGVVGRPAGALADFKYTDANRKSGLTWDAATLDRYLQAPQKVVPGTAMPYPGLKDATQRGEVVPVVWTAQRRC